MCREESKMAKPLWEFVEKRMKELGMTRYDLETENDIAYATVQRIKAGSTNIKDSTKQKLALALKCSMGDINNAIYNQVASAPEAAGEPSVMETVDKLEKIIRKEHPDMAVPAGDAGKPKQENKRPKECWPVDEPGHKPALTFVRTYTAAELKTARQEAVDEYRQKLKDICLHALVGVSAVINTVETSYSVIGKKLLQELTNDEAGTK